MKTNPWLKVEAKQASAERFVKSRGGIMGNLATFHSITKKMPRVTKPNTIRQITVGEDQGYEMPPNPRPSRNITTPPTLVMRPSQSMALRPGIMGVRGVSMSRKKKRIAKAKPSHGTYVD